MISIIKLTIATLTLPTVFILTGCEQRYRYPCQDVNNWSTPQCQKPLCEVHRECPDLIIKQ